MRQAAWLLWKDALAEARGFERISTLAVFAVAVLLTFHFTLAPDADARPVVAAGFLWAAVIFAALLELRRSFEAERAEGTLEGLRASPLDATALYAAKLASSFVVLAVLEAVLVPIVAVGFGGRIDGVPAAYGVMLLGTLGLVAWGTLFAAAAGGTRSGEVVLAVLLFPLVVPQTIAAVRLVGHYLGGTALDEVWGGFVILGAFDLLSLGTSILLFEYVLEE